MVGTILEKIVETKRRDLIAARRERPLEHVRQNAGAAAPCRNFYDALVAPQLSAHNGIRLIAEVKKASPSAGVIRADFDAIATGEAYQSGGASALSILTDRQYFLGDLSYIDLVRTPVSLPILRKDFIIDEYQVYESRAAGADAILLIAAILTPDEMKSWSALSFELGMSTLIEVHDERELQTVLPMIKPDRRTLLGINNRDLKIQRTSLDTTRRLAELLPAGTPFVTESGIHSREDAVFMQSLGATAMLVGESLMRKENIRDATRELLGIDGD